MRVLVCGGRDFDAHDDLFAELNHWHRLQRITLVIHGGAPGADSCAGRWAEFCAVPVARFNADWKAHGRAAGPIRNQRMIDEGKPDFVIAFPGGRGTADMVRRAKAANIRVIEVSEVSHDHP